MHLGCVVTGRANRLLLSRLISIVKHFGLRNDSINLVMVLLWKLLLLILTANAMELRRLILLLLHDQMLLLLICDANSHVL